MPPDLCRPRGLWTGLGPLAAEVARRGWSPTFICESAGTQAEDARTMKEIYQAQRALYSSQ